jgi:DNA replication protein DnaC
LVSGSSEWSSTPPALRACWNIRSNEPNLPGARHGGHRVLFATASEWVDRLATAHHAGRLQDELRRLARSPLLVVVEVGCIPFEPEAANLFFPLVSSRYERASRIVTSTKSFDGWGEVFVS